MFKLFERCKIVRLMFLSCFSTLALGNAAEVFEDAWRNPSFTQIELEPIDVNAVLASHYVTDKPVHFTRSLLWKMEVQKAWHPETYIPHVVQEARSWPASSMNIGAATPKDGWEHLARFSLQKQWLSDRHELVLEQVHLDHSIQKAIFIGTRKLPNDRGQELVSYNSQDPFHVEHGVGGTEDIPLNTWRIVHLTKKKNERLLAKFSDLRSKNTLPGYVLVFIERDLGIRVRAK